MQQDKTFLGTDPVGQLLRRLAIPTVIAQLVNMLYNIVDRIYIGHIPEVGSAALTGVGVCLPIILIVSAFACFTASGGAPRASIYMGRDDMDSAEKTLGGCFTLQIGISVVLTAALLLWGRDALLAFGASENTIGYAADYLHIYAFGTLFVELTLGMNAFITAQGFAKTGMYTVLIGAAANIILDPVFIFALDMGVRGAALATVLSQVCSTAYILRFLLGGKAAVGITRQPVNPGWMRRIVQVGLSPALIIALDNVLLISVNVMLRKYGGADSDMLIACAAVMQSFMLIITMPLGGITAGTQSILGYNYGAGNTKRILQAFRSIILLCLVFCGVMFAIAQTVSGSFVQIFTKDPVYIDMASYMIRTYSLGVLGLAVQYPAVDGMTGMGLIRWGLTFSMLRKGLFLVCVFVLPPLFGATAVMFSEPVSDITAAVFSAGGLAFVLPKLMRKREAEG